MESEKTIERVITREASHLAREDEEVNERIRRLLLSACDEAETILKHGAPQDAVAVVKLLLGRAAASASMEGTDGREEVWAAYERIFESQRHVEAVGLGEDEMKELTP